MRDRFGLVGARSGELLTYQGRAILHDNRREMEFLFPNTRVVRVTRGTLGQPWMWLKDHPSMEKTSFPLRREEFADAEG
jgi:hypothetical protein